MTVRYGERRRIVAVVGVKISPVDHVKRETLTRKQSLKIPVICG